jgi:5-oxoprolinase (ATP-hydrolysing) subunit C
MIEIAQTPPLNTVQDLGRFGYRRYGIGCAGAMDRIALAAGNIALGNDANLAGIEFQLFPVRILFWEDAAIAITGADCAPELDGRPLPPWWAFNVEAGQTLTLTSPLSGMRSYLTVAGGIDVPVVLGSRSTQSRDGFGGFLGRALRAGDKLPIAPGAAFRYRDALGLGIQPPETALKCAHHAWADDRDVVLRVISASEYEQFDEQSLRAFKAAAWTVTVQSNRMGYRLAGPSLQRTNPTEMRSQGIVAGVIQVPPSGQPIIQLSDGNSAGGYPKIAIVVQSDLWRVAQAAPGRSLRFVQVSLDEARAARVEQSKYLEEISRLSSYCRFPKAVS